MIIKAKARMTNPVSVTKRRPIALPSGIVDTFTLFIGSSSSQRTLVTSIKKRYEKFTQIGEENDLFFLVKKP